MVILADFVGATALAGLVRIEERVSADSVRVERLVKLAGHTVWRSVRIASTITPFKGNAYIFRVANSGPWLVPWADSNWEHRGAKTAVLENDTALGPAHTLHDAVIRDGTGRFSHWESFVLFSTSDNTNAASNGREYRFEYALRPAEKVLLVLLVGNVLCLRYTMKRRRLRMGTGPAEHLTALTARVVPYLALLAILVAVIFAGKLLTEWSTGVTRYSPIGGFLPWSDAGGWLLGATHFLHSGELLDWPTRRPLFAVYLGFLSFLSSENLPVTLAINATIAAVACFLLCAWTRVQFGIAASLGSLLVLSMFGMQYAGTTLSESFGFSLGAIAFALMFMGIRGNSIRDFGFGYFLFSLAMSARPGPVLVLGTMFLWAVFIWQRNRSDRLRMAAVLAAGISTAAGLTLAWAKFFGAATGMPGANFAFTLYGLAMGGKPWQQFSEDFPDSAPMAEVAQAAMAYRESFAQIWREPGMFVSGYMQFASSYLSSFFGYVGTGWLRSGLIMVAMVGLIAVLLKPRDRFHSFLLAVAIGAVASAGLIFWSFDAVRAFIPMAAVDAMFVAIGLVKLLAIIGIAGLSAVTGTATVRVLRSTTVLVGIFLVLGCTLFPLAASRVFRDFRLDVSTCRADEQPFAFHAGRSSPYIHVVDETVSRSWPPNVRRADFLASNFSGHELETILNKVDAGDYLISVYNLSVPLGSTAWSSYHRFVYIRAESLPPGFTIIPGDFYQGCGADSRSIALLFEARSVARAGAP